MTEFVPADNMKFSGTALWERRNTILQQLKEVAEAAEDTKSPERQQKQRFTLFSILLSGPFDAAGKIERRGRFVERIAVIKQKV